MRKVILTAIWLVVSVSAHGQSSYQQTLVEAEQVSGGTVIQDINASAEYAVTRTSVGIYTWWVRDISNFPGGVYSLYARVALNPSGTAPENFGSFVFVTDNTGVQYQVGWFNHSVTTQVYQWIRLGSFWLWGNQFQESDWSDPGINVDELAIIPDNHAFEADVAGGTVVPDPTANNENVVTRHDVGIYGWWVVPSTQLARGDYNVYVNVRSSDGASHNYGGYVTLGNSTYGPVNTVVSWTSYQGILAGTFNYDGTKPITISDWSEPGLMVESIDLVRQTPSDPKSGAQILFSSATTSDPQMNFSVISTALGPIEEVVFQGVPGLNGVTGPDEGRPAIVQANSGTVYAYFRQKMSDGNFQIYMATSTDGGKTFSVNPVPVIPKGQYIVGAGTLASAYDPQVYQERNGYYMVFEGYGAGCGVSSFVAYSPDGVNNWSVENAPVCSAFSTQGSASTPSYFTDVVQGTRYIQWVSLNSDQQITTHNQAVLPYGLFFFNAGWSLQPRIVVGPQASTTYQLPQDPPNAWDGYNFGAGHVYYENGFYYLVYEGADFYSCTAPAGHHNQWGIGIARTSTPSDLNSWTRSAFNPLLSAVKTDSCWLAYPELVSLPDGLYLYYNYSYLNWTNPPYRTIYRQRILTN